MKWLSYTLAALLAAAVAVSIVGIVADSARLDLWTQMLMWCMLGTVVLVPFAVYAGTRPEHPAQPSKQPATGRSPLRLAAYAFSVVAVVWTAISMVSLFVDPENLAFWTQSVLWSLLVLIVWAPIMAFFINPFQETRSTTAAEAIPDFVDHEAPAFSSPPAVEQPAVEQPAVEQPAVEQPAVEQPAADNGAAEQIRTESEAVQTDAEEADTDDRGWPYV